MRWIQRTGSHCLSAGASVLGLGVGAFGLALLVSLVSSTTLRAQFNEPRLVSDGTGTTTECAIGLDDANNTYVVSVAADSLRVDLFGPNLETRFSIPSSGLAQSEPRIVNSSRGEAFVCFSQLDSDVDSVGREICLTHNGGGRFVEPIEISQNRVDDYAPALALDLNGLPRVVWTRAIGEAQRVVYYEHSTRRSVEIADGSYPSIWVDLAGVAHIIYSRANDLYYRNNSGGSFGPEIAVVTTPTEPEYFASIAGSESGRLFIAYESGGSLYLAVKRPEDAEFQAPARVASGGVLEPELRVRSSGGFSIVYSRGGDLFYIQGISPEVLVGPHRVGEPSATVESRPGIVVDPCGIVHVVGISDGDVYYRNNAAQIDAEFTADVTSGEVPLTVRFSSLTSGKVQSYAWNFGDGRASSGERVTHTFTEPGVYTVELTVNTADLESTETKREYIFVEEPFNVLWVPNLRAYPGDENVWIPIKAQNREPVMAYQVHGTVDPAVARVRECTLISSVTTHFSPEVWEWNVFPEEGRYEIGCIFDFTPPFDFRRLPPGTRHTLVHVVLDIEPTAPVGARSRMDLVNDRETSPIFNIFTVDNISKLPTLRGGVLSIVDPAVGERKFIRGDVNDNGRIEITDAIRLLNFLFLGGPGPTCMDAADPSDVGRVDLSGAVNILNFLFLFGRNPQPPFPAPGLDPTPDDLPCD